MSKSIYRTLPSGSIRLLQLKPDLDDHAPIQCGLLECPILDSGRSSLYEAVSYVWGSGDKPRSISITPNGCNFPVGENLHAALVALRDPVLERLIWVDAVCINQEDDTEKGHQVQAMAKIYARARGVVVWLGPATAGSRQAFQLIHGLAFHKTEILPRGFPMTPPMQYFDKDSVLDLVRRAWFKRIWILQEVAAARHIVIKSGSDEMSSDAFCAGLSSLHESIEQRNHKDGNVLDPDNEIRNSLLQLHPVTRLMRHAGFRSRNENYDSPRYSLNIAPLSELIDLYKRFEATDPRDKIYALLGMSSDDPGAAGLVPDYTICFEQLMQRYINNHVSPHAHVTVSDDKNIIVIRARGYVDATIANRRELMKPLWIIDVVCQFQDAKCATLIRRHTDYSEVIQMSLGYDCFYTNPCVIDFLLVWDWSSKIEGRGSENDVSWFQDIGGPKSIDSSIDCPLQAEIRLLSAAMIEYNIWETLRASHQVRLLGWVKAAMDVYHKFLTSPAQGSTATGKEPERPPPASIEDSRFREPGLGEGDRVASLLAKLTLLSHTHLNSDKNWHPPSEAELIFNPLIFTTSNGLVCVAQRILTCDDPVLNGLAELRLAVNWDNQTIIRSLLSTGKVLPWLKDNDLYPVAVYVLQRSLHYMTPGKPRVVNHDAPKARSLDTFLTFNNGIGQGILGAGLGVQYLIDLPLFRYLMDRYELDLNSRHPDGQTILMMAAKANRLDIVEYLLGGNVKASHHPCHDRDSLGQTPLMIAAAHGAHKLVKCLLDSGEALPNAKNTDGQTALMIAALASKRFNIKTLMESEQSELDFKTKDGQTLLMIASRKGWRDIVHELLKTAIGQSQLNATDDQGQTALLYALKEGKQNGSWELAFGCLLVAIRLLQDEHTDIGIVDVDGNSTVSILREWGMDVEDDWNRAKILEYAKVWYEENEPEQLKHLQLDWTRVLTPSKTRVRDRVRSFIGV